MFVHNKYAELFDMPLSTLFKKALEEKIENEIKVNPDLANIIEKIKEDIQ